MPEVQKYNLKEKLMEADEKYRGDPAVSGMSSMTHFRYNNSTRTQMLTSHLNQIVNIIHGKPSHVYTGAENVVGRNSSGYMQLKNDITVYRKVVKFEDLVDTPFVYQLFYFDEKKKKYDVVERREIEENLSQNYAYAFNNEKIDSLVEGDHVPAGEVLYKSRSYDDYMNYCYGRDLPVVYSLDPYTAEDAAIISEYASEALTSVHGQKLSWGWNNNDIPLNIHGDDDHYKPLPYIGEHVEGYVASSRPQINEQLIYDFTHKNLSQIRDGDRSIEFPGKGIVVDYDIYCNNPDLEDDYFNHQILELLNAQNKYWEEVQETCLEIMNSGYDYSRQIDLLYKKSTEFLDTNPNRKWNNGKSVFNNLEFRATIVEYTPLREGGKFSARYGNKSVVSAVWPNHKMPFTADGKRADIVLNLLAIVNRTTAEVLHEMFINWILDLTVDEIKKAPTMEKQEELLFNILDDLNHEEYAAHIATYKKLSKKDKKAYIQDVIDEGIFIRQNSLVEDVDIFHKLIQIFGKYDYLKPQTMYVYKFGQIYRMGQPMFLGKMYFFPLKQTDQRGFSGRSTGAINMKGLPERSYKNKRNEAAFSDTAIRFGEYENMTFLIGLDPEELVCMHAMYRTSPEATSDLTKAQFAKKGYAKFKKYYKSRAAEIFSVYYRHLGMELTFEDPDTTIKSLDNSSIKEHSYNGKVYLTTDYEFYKMRIRDKIRDQILAENTIMSKDRLEAAVEEELENAAFILGPRRKNDRLFSEDVED